LLMRSRAVVVNSSSGWSVKMPSREDIVAVGVVVSGVGRMSGLQVFVLVSTFSV
jgi:hypothetical protein